MAVIVEITDGLGNQLFQYAAGRRLAHDLKLPLLLDIAHYRSGWRIFQLDHFHIQAGIATPGDFPPLYRHPLTLKLARFLGRRLLPRQRRYVFREIGGQVFNPEFEQIRGSVFLQGQYQNERYFKPIELIIRREFRLKDASDAQNEAMTEQIRAVESVSVHVRRGDLVKLPASRMLTLNYYQTAVDQLRAQVAKPHLFVFSDDPDWAEAHLDLGLPMTVVRHNGPERDYEDLRLMSLCRHHIIANSTFSWWGAWLSDNPNKLVYAPSPWSKWRGLGGDEALPDSWIKIPTLSAI